MKHAFVDLHLRLNMKDSSGALRILKKAAGLGYSLIGVPLSSEESVDVIAKLQTDCMEIGVDFVSRIDLQPRTQNELMRQLRRLRRKFEVVCVFCENKAIARQAAKDRRVDLLNFPFFDFQKRFFDKAEAELARNGLTALEIDIKPLLVLEGPARVRLLSHLCREVAIAKSFGVPVVVSSGVSMELLLRKPREMAALGFLFGLDEVFALEAVSRRAFAIVERNRQKLNGKFVAPGIRMVREGKDC